MFALVEADEMKGEKAQDKFTIINELTRGRGIFWQKELAGRRTRFLITCSRARKTRVTGSSYSSYLFYTVSVFLDARWRELSRNWSGLDSQSMKPRHTLLYSKCI
jgi:hypothetical protein